LKALVGICYSKRGEGEAFRTICQRVFRPKTANSTVKKPEHIAEVRYRYYKKDRES